MKRFLVIERDGFANVVQTEFDTETEAHAYAEIHRYGNTNRVQVTVTQVLTNWQTAD